MTKPTEIPQFVSIAWEMNAPLPTTGEQMSLTHLIAVAGRTMCGGPIPSNRPTVETGRDQCFVCFKRARAKQFGHRMKRRLETPITESEVMSAVMKFVKNGGIIKKDDNVESDTS